MHRSPGNTQAAAELAQWRGLLLIAVCLTVPVFVIARILPHFPAAAAALNVMLFGFPLDELLKWLLTTPIQASPASTARRSHTNVLVISARVITLMNTFEYYLATGPVKSSHAACMICPQFVVAWRFHVGAYKALKRGAANMDVLVSLGTNASYFYSVMSVAHHHLMVGVAWVHACGSSLGQTD